MSSEITNMGAITQYGTCVKKEEIWMPMHPQSIMEWGFGAENTNTVQIHVWGGQHLP
jgi:hypothetical protein